MRAMDAKSTPDDRPSIAELQRIEREMTEISQWRSAASYNNAGMPLADFTIPGHNAGATVEMLAVDADGIVALRLAAPVLLDIAAAAREWQMLPQAASREARRRLLAALSRVRS